MALGKEKQALVEKISGQNYRDWEQSVCNKEGMELIQGKGDSRNELLESKFSDLLSGYAAKTFKKDHASENLPGKDNHESKKANTFTPNTMKK